MRTEKEFGGFQEGGGASECFWSDRHACTVVSVSEREVVVSRDIARLKTGTSEYDGNAEYIYETDSDAWTTSYTLRKNGRWIQKGAKMQNGTYIVPGRHEYRDPHF